MSSVATAYFCEEGAVEALIDLFRKTQKAEPVKMKVLEFMRKANRSPQKIRYNILLITGLSDLVKSEYADANPFMMFRESLRNLSRGTTLIIQVESLKWSPTKQGEVTIDGVAMGVSEIDIDTTMRLQTEHLGTGKSRRKNTRDNFVIARL